MREHSVINKTLFTLLLLLLKKHDSLELRNCVSVSHRLLAVKGETPTIKVTPKAHKRRLTPNRLADHCALLLLSQLEYKRRRRGMARLFLAV